MNSYLKFLFVITFCFENVVAFTPLAGWGAEQKLMNPVVGIISDSNCDMSDESSVDRISGSGFIIDKSGLILTNCHVIDGSSKIEVVFHNGMRCPVKLRGKDKQYDTALLEIPTEKLHDVIDKFKGELPTVTFDNSDIVEITTPIFISGHPFGLNTRIATGIVSSKVSSLPDQVNKSDFNGDIPFLQLDARVEHGDSGAPLFTYDCKVIGMVTVFMSDGMQNTGIGYAIPSNLLKKIVDQLKAFGKIHRSWIGISTVALSREVESALGLGKRCGIAISEVEKNSPAAIAGIHEDDILLSVNDENITENTNSDYMLSNLPFNKLIKVVVMRAGHEMVFNVRVGVKDEDDTAIYQESLAKKEISYQKIDYLSVGVAELTADLKKHFNIPEKINGVLIANVGNESSRMSVGNVILSVNQTIISNISDLTAEMRKITASKADKVTLHIYDSNRQQHLYIAFSLIYLKPAGK
ncbi:MAG: trypsin-like peptidase domain-containing protein [Alphaproteobacteria bacterium]|nr:trypsin-like peptidase domain-containing protein [Alphaproteobacteria bacterium]